MRHLLKSLIRSRWEPVVVLMKTHWIGRKPPLPSHWGGVWGAELWRRRLDFTSQLPGPTGQSSSGHPYYSTSRAARQQDGRAESTHSATASRSASSRTAPSHPDQHTNTAPCWDHTEPLQRVLKVNT